MIKRESIMRRGAALAITFAVLMGSDKPVIADGMGVNPNLITSIDKKVNETLTNIYVRPNEYNASPRIMIAEGQHYNPERGQVGCGGHYLSSERVIASWFYPCGTEVEITNNDPKSPGYQEKVVAEVVDRGPNRYIHSVGWENDRIRKVGIDMSEGTAKAIDHVAGDEVIVEILKLPPGYTVINRTLNLLESAPFSNGIPDSWFQIPEIRHFKAS